MKTPVVLFIFKRKQTLARIMERIAQAAPERLYIIADQGRDEAEKALAEECRNLVESLVTWDCELVKDYASENRGGLCANWTWRRACVRKRGYGDIS